MRVKLRFQPADALPKVERVGPLGLQRLLELPHPSPVLPFHHAHRLAMPPARLLRNGWRRMLAASAPGEREKAMRWLDEASERLPRHDGACTSSAGRRSLTGSETRRTMNGSSAIRALFHRFFW